MQVVLSDVAVSCILIKGHVPSKWYLGKLGQIPHIWGHRARNKSFPLMHKVLSTP